MLNCCTFPIPCQVPLIAQYPNLKPCVRQAVEKAVSDYANPVLDRSIKIVLTTTEQVVKKDFSLDPDEGHVRVAAHSMVRHLTAGMAMITCREPLLMAISSNLKAAFNSLLRVSGFKSLFCVRLLWKQYFPNSRLQRR